MEIGDRKVVYNCSLILPEGETASIEFLIDHWRVKIQINFLNDAERTSESIISINRTDQELLITFLNWKNPVGTATIKPVEIGRTNTRQQLSMMAAHWFIGSVNKLDLHFLLDNKS